jgi:hypothetical protein
MADNSPPGGSYPLPTNVQGGVGIPMNGYPVQSVAPDQGSSGGLVNKGGQIIGGAQAGQNSANQAAQMHRSAVEWQQEQQGQAALAKGVRSATTDPAAAPSQQPAIPPPPGSHGGFFDSITNSPVGRSIMAGVHAIGSAISGHTGAPQAGAIPPPGAQGAPGSAPVASAGPGQPPQIVTGHQKGGVITEPEFMTPLPTQPQPTMVGMQGGGVVPHPHAARFPGASRNERNYETVNGGGALKPPPHTMTGDQMGVVSGGVRGIQGFEGGGVIPPVANVPPMQGSSGGLVNVAGQIIGGAQAGQNSANQQEQMNRATTQFQQDQRAREASAVPFADLINTVHRDLHDNALDDTGVPNNTRGVMSRTDNPYDTPAQIAAANQLPGGSSGAATPQPAPAAPAPAPAGAGAPGAGAVPAQPAPSSGPPTDPVQAAATAQAVSQAASNKAGQQGIPENSPTESGKPHSLTDEFWQKSDRDIAAAAAAAAQAGHDPSAVFQSLNATRNAFIQGHVLRNLSAANVAMLNGDQSGVEKALRNAYYYIPDGKDLTIQKQGGQLVYQDPINPFLDSNGNPTRATTGKPNMVPVDAAHIQMLGTAMLDPQAVNGLIMGARSAMAQQQLEASRAQAALQTGAGREKVGEARLMEAQTNAGLAPSKQYSNIARGDQSEAQAGYLRSRGSYLKQAIPKLDPQLQKQSDAAAAAVDQAVHGPSVSLPADPATGTPARNGYDATRADPRLKGADEQTINGVKAIAQDLYISNGGTLPPQAAAQKALELYEQGKLTHSEPGGRTKVPDVQVDRARGTIHVWDRKNARWGALRLSQYGAGRLADNGISGVTDPVADSMAAGGGEQGIPTGDGNDATDAAVMAPDSEDSSTS